MSRPRASGFTIYEITVVIGLIVLLTLAVSQVFASNTNLAEDTRAHQRAEAAQRANLVALSRILRVVDMQTLDGFNTSGVAIEPSFLRVTGADSESLTHGEPETLKWFPSPVPVNGVERPGAVYLVRNLTRILVADRVPAGGFRVRQEGQNLVIHLSTYWSTNAGRVVTKTGKAVVSVRN